MEIVVECPHCEVVESKHSIGDAVAFASKHAVCDRGHLAADLEAAP